MIMPYRPNRRDILTITLALTLSAFVTPASADDSSPAKAVIQHFYDVLLDVMKHADALGFKGRYAELDPVIAQTFDLDAMARIAVGPPWLMMSDDIHQQLAGRFHRFTVATYANQFNGYGGEKFVVGEVKTMPNPAGKPVADELVETQLIQGNGEPVVLNYLMRQRDGIWRVVDIYLVGSISQLASQRSEFGSVIRSEGGDGLVKVLDDKIGQLSK